MAVSGYEYTIDGENYIDIKGAADVLGMSLTTFRNLIRGIEFAKKYDLQFVRQGHKVLFLKEKLDILKKDNGSQNTDNPLRLSVSEPLTNI